MHFKLIFTFLLIILGYPAFGQNWRDSLAVARKLYKEQSYDEALSYYKSAQKLAPKEIDLSDEMAQSAYKARNFEQAEKIYAERSHANVKAGQKSNSLHNLGNSRMQTKNYQGAVDAYKEALRLNPDDAQTRYNLSVALRKLKEQQQQENKSDQQQNQQNQQNQSNKNQQQNQGQQKDSQQKNSQQQSAQNKSSNGDNSGTDQKGQLSNKSVERMLDDLMKKEAETKRRVAGGSKGNRQSATGKDW